MAFFVYSNDSMILFIIVTLFHKLYIFLLKCRGCLFLCPAWVFSDGIYALWRGHVPCKIAFYDRHIYMPSARKYKHIEVLEDYLTSI